MFVCAVVWLVGSVVGRCVGFVADGDVDDDDDYAGADAAGGRIQ